MEGLPTATAVEAIAAVRSDTGRRDTMEDAHVLEVQGTEPLRVLGAVFDGHNGAGVAQFAAERLPQLFRDHLDRGPDEALRRAFELIDEATAEMEGGAVAAAFYIDGDRVIVVNVGDAHIVGVSGREAVRYTEDHRLTNISERERVVASGAIIDGPYVCLSTGDGLMPTRTLGDHAFQEVGVISAPAVSTRLAPSDFLIAACDGLWDVVERTELPDLLDGLVTADQAADRLLHEALNERWTMDNVTILVVRTRRPGHVEGPSPTKSLITALTHPRADD